MKYLIIIHFLINAIILAIYLLSKKEKINILWREVAITLLFGWIVVFVIDDN